MTPDALPAAGTCHHEPASETDTLMAVERLDRPSFVYDKDYFVAA
jgi:hypothetical protein